MIKAGRAILDSVYWKTYLNQSSMLQQGDILNRYEIHSVIGQGGFGVVYKGEHRELGIEVAIKEYFPSELCVRQGGTVQPIRGKFQVPFQEGLERFLKEAKQLEKFRDCPNIVTCRDLFRANGTAYTIMEYVQGLPLSTLLERRESRGEPSTEQELLDLILPLLSGLQTVHDAGVCHRDIKPSNILVRRDDSTPILIDFGAAKQEISRHTKSLAPYTDGYAAMEQVGDGKIGPWTDIYGLGAVMWRVVAGGNPTFSPLNPTTVQKRAYAIMQGQSDPLPTVAEIGKGRFSTEILQAIDHCLVVNENKRTQSCAELLSELKPSVGNAEEETDQPSLLGNKEDIPPGPLDVPIQNEASKADSAKKSDGWMFTILAVFGIIILLVMAINLQLENPNPDLDQTHSAHQSNQDGSSPPLNQTDPLLQPNQDELSPPPNQTDPAPQLNQDDPSIPPNQDVQIPPLNQTSLITQEEHRLTGHTTRVRSVVFSPDGSRLASSGYDGIIRLWDVDTGIETYRLPVTTDIKMAFSPDGSRLASSGYDGIIRLWDVDTGKETRRLTEHTSNFTAMAFSPDGSRLATGSADGTIRLWDVDTSVEMHRLTGHTDIVWSVAFSPDGFRLVSGSSDETIRLWDMDTGKETRRLTVGTGHLVSLALSPDGSQLASASYDKTIPLWDLDTGKETRRLIGHTGSVYSVAFSPDGSRLVSGSHDQTVRLWDVDTGVETLSLNGPTSWVNTVAFSPDGRRIAYEGGDGIIRLWKITRLKNLLIPAKAISVLHAPHTDLQRTVTSVQGP